MTQPPSPSHAALDRTGVIASVGCAIHCMVAPVLLVAAPTLGGWWVHPATHLAIAALVLPIAASALRRGFRVHQRRWILVAGTAGMALVLIGVVLPWALPSGLGGACGTCRDCCPTLVQDPTTGVSSLRIPPASIVTMLGGAALVVAHAGNLRCACRRCDVSDPGTH